MGTALGKSCLLLEQQVGKTLQIRKWSGQWIWAKRYNLFQVCFSFTQRHVLLPVGRYNNMSLLMTWQATVQTLGLIHEVHVCTYLILTYAYAHITTTAGIYQYFLNYGNLYVRTKCMCSWDCLESDMPKSFCALWNIWSHMTNKGQMGVKYSISNRDIKYTLKMDWLGRWNVDKINNYVSSG